MEQSPPTHTGPAQDVGGLHRPPGTPGRIPGRPRVPQGDCAGGGLGSAGVERAMTAPPVRTPPAAPQRRYGFLTSRRWIALIAGIVALSVLCVFLGYWQWTRHQNREIGRASCRDRGYGWVWTVRVN